MRIALDLVIRSSAILAVGLMLEALLTRRSAALRHAVLASAVFVSVASLPLAWLLPTWEVSVSMPVPDAEPRAVIPASGPDRLIAGPASASRNPAVFLATVWAAGTLAGSALLLASMVRIIRIGRRARRVRDPRWIASTLRVSAAYGLTRRVVVLQTDVPDLMATWGVFRPRVLLPSHALGWSDERIHVVLSHELAHIRRHDWIVQFGAELVRTACWFNPLMWIACTRLRRASEQACDDVVLGEGVEPGDYAAQLLALARKCRTAGRPWAAGMPIARASTLERRITAMLNPTVDRRPVSHRTQILVGALLLVVAIPVAAFRAAQSGPAPLSGAVYDPSGAVMPGVSLTLEDAQQSQLEASTTAAGRFTFQAVPAGRYVLGASIPGFRPLRQEFELQNARDWDRAITLQVGELRETIMVSERRVAPPSAPSQPRAAQPVRVGGNIKVPRKEHHVSPAYPASMRDAGREGTVPIEAVIGQDGTVISLRVLSAQVHPDFAIAAVDAVRQWRFTPTLLNGAPVEIVMTVTITFNLSD